MITMNYIVQNELSSIRMVDSLQTATELAYKFLEDYDYFQDGYIEVVVLTPTGEKDEIFTKASLEARNKELAELKELHKQWLPVLDRIEYYRLVARSLLDRGLVDSTDITVARILFAQAFGLIKHVPAKLQEAIKLGDL